MKRTDTNLLNDILEAIQSIQRHQPASRDEMVTDEPISALVQHRLSIIGEAAGRLTPRTRNLAPEVPWGNIIGIRNRLVHDYADVNWEVVWNVVTHELEPLQQQVETLLQSLTQT